MAALLAQRGLAGVLAASPSAQTREAVQRQTAAALAELAEALHRRNLTATTEVRTGKPAVALLDTMRPDAAR